jgi:hypothetical protein
MSLTTRAFLAAICGAVTLAMGTVRAASSFSDPLTSFDAGRYTVSSVNPIVYDGGGAHFGTTVAGDDGRGYQRTTDSDYAAASFVAEITFTVT